VHHRTTLLGYIFATEAQSEKPVKQQYLPYTSSQYGELRLTNGWDRLTSLGHSTSAATISLVAFSCERKRKRAKRLWMRPLFQRQHKYYVTWLHQTLSLATTFWPLEYFRTRLKACSYCMQELHRVACNNCTRNHGIMSNTNQFLYQVNVLKVTKVS